MARERQKVRVGRVISDKTDQTVVVAVRWQQPHPLYKKSIRRTTKLYAHDKENQCKPGDLVRIQETRPISRTKHWRVTEILERREVVDVKPAELDEGLFSEEQAAREAAALMAREQEQLAQEAEDIPSEEGATEAAELEAALLDEEAEDTLSQEEEVEAAEPEAALLDEEAEDTPSEEEEVEADEPEAAPSDEEAQETNEADADPTEQEEKVQEEDPA